MSLSLRCPAVALPLRPALRRGGGRVRSPAVALFGPSKKELALRLQLDQATRALQEASRRSAELALALEAERAARKASEETTAAWLARVNAADKEVFKLEQRLVDADKTLASYSATAERQIAALAAALKQHGITL